jgi:hypothetical protein
VATLLDALPPGSYLAASHGTIEHQPPGTSAAVKAYQSGRVPFRPRDSEEFAELAFKGTQLVPPGVVLVSEWRPDTRGPRPPAAEVNTYGGVALKISG